MFTNETGFIVQRFVKAKGSCNIDAAFGTQQVAANATGFTDTAPPNSTCGYQVAARNAQGDSSFVRDMNVGAGNAP